MITVELPEDTAPDERQSKATWPSARRALGSNRVCVFREQELAYPGDRNRRANQKRALGVQKHVSISRSDGKKNLARYTYRT